MDFVKKTDEGIHIDIEAAPVGTRVVMAEGEFIRLADRIRIINRGEGGREAIIDVFPGGRMEIVSGEVVGHKGNA